MTLTKLESPAPMPSRARTLVLRPETSDEVIEPFADRVLTEEEFVEGFDRLDAALDRE